MRAVISSSLPEGPSIPPRQQKRQWHANDLLFMETCAQVYGDIFTVWIRPHMAPEVFVSNPEGLKEIFTADGEKLDAGEEVGQYAPDVGKNSLFFVTGAPHRRLRKLLIPPFHGERMQTYGHLIGNITKQVTSEWQIGQTISIAQSMGEISLQSILQVVFGLQDITSEHYQKLKQLLTQRRNPEEGRKINRNARNKQIDALIYATIAQRRSSDSAHNDILSLLMAAHDEEGEGMSDEELHDNLMTLLIAGEGTTMAAMTWGMYLIHRHPLVLTRLKQELDSLGKDADALAVSKLPYLQAVCQETLRLYPSLPLGTRRAVKAPITIMGYQLEPGVNIVPCIYLAHRRPEIYPEPQQFRPERFLERKFSPYEYLPFGSGQRSCIGRAFAQFQMKLVLATLIRHWQLELTESKPVSTTRHGLTLHPASTVPMVVMGNG